jgi:hypothetical protein
VSLYLITIKVNKVPRAGLKSNTFDLLDRLNSTTNEVKILAFQLEEFKNYRMQFNYA